MESLLSFQYRISNISYNVTSSHSYHIPYNAAHAPVYITVGDGGNPEDVAGRYAELFFLHFNAQVGFYVYSLDFPTLIGIFSDYF